MARVRRAFFARYTPEVARAMLGLVLVSDLGGTRLAGRIVETEAYRGRDDQASHAYGGRSRRNEVMFGPPGHAYVYFTYGAHYCLNVTTEGEGEPGAVLIRAIEPIEGVDVMRRRRGMDDVVNLGNGPGKLTKALGVDSSLNGEDMITSERLFLTTGEHHEDVAESTRVGISSARELRWRYYLAGNGFVSRGRTHNYRTRNPGRKKGSSASLVQASNLREAALGA